MLRPQRDLGVQPNLQGKRKFNFLTIGIDIVKGDHRKRVKRRFGKFITLLRVLFLPPTLNVLSK